MASTVPGQVTREELLGGLPARRASTLLFAIEGRTAQLVSRSRQAMAGFLPEKTAEARERAFFDALAQGRELPVRVSIQDLERYAPDWADLVPRDPGIRATLLRMIGEKYLVPAHAVPNLRRALGLDDEAVARAFERLHGRPLGSVFAIRIPWRERLRWVRSRVALALETLPPFWTTYALTLTSTVGAGILALPIAFAEIGPLAGVVVMVVFGLVSVLTIAAMAEAVARNGNARHGRAYSGRLLSDYFGKAMASVVAPIELILSIVWLGAFYIGLASILASATPVPAWLWVALLFLVGVYFVRRPTLDATVASSLVVGAVNLALLLTLTALALANARAANLGHARIPFVTGEPLSAPLLGLVFGVVLVAYAGHWSVNSSARVALPRDPSARSLIRGSAAGLATAVVLYCAWILGVNGAVEPRALAAESGTALSPLADAVGPAALVVGTVFGSLAMGLISVYIVIGLSLQVREWLPRSAEIGGPRPPTGRLARALRAAARTERRQVGLAVAPAVVAFAFVEWLFLTGRESFTDALSFLGVISLAAMAGIFPMLMVYAGRRMGDYPVATAWRPVGHPVVVAAVCLSFLVAVLLHGLVIWEAAYQRGAASVAGVGIAVLIALLVRRGAFTPRAVIGLRLDDRARAAAFQVTANGAPAQADACFRYDGGERCVRASADRVPLPAALRSAAFRLPATPARQLKVWAHRIAPDGSSTDLPALLDVGGGPGEGRFDLGRQGGQVVLPLDGAPVHLTISLPPAPPPNHRGI